MTTTTTARTRAAADAAATPGPERNSTFTLLVLLAGTFIAILDFFIVNVALPATQQDLHASSATIQWIFVFTALGLGYLAASLRSGRMAARLGRQVLAAGACLQAAGYALLGVTVHEFGTGRSVLWLIPALVVIGCGMGFTLAPMIGTVLAGVAPRHAAAAAGLVSTMQQVGGALGVAVIGIVYFGLLGSAPPAATFGHAFGGALTAMTGFCLVTAALVQLLPKRSPAS
jgi:MFS family permease